MEYQWDRYYIMLVHVSQYIITYIVLGKICTLRVQPLKGEVKYYKVLQNLLLG